MSLRVKGERTMKGMMPDASVVVVASAGERCEWSMDLNHLDEHPATHGAGLLPREADETLIDPSGQSEPTHHHS